MNNLNNGYKKFFEQGPQYFEWLAKNKDGMLIWFENSMLHANLGGTRREFASTDIRDYPHHSRTDNGLSTNPEIYHKQYPSLEGNRWKSFQLFSLVGCTDGESG